MSDSYTNTNQRSETLNETAAHDTGLYDPNVHDNQIVAMYDTEAQAHAAREALLSSGVPESAIHVANNDERPAQDASSAEDSNSGLWGAIRSLFMPDDEAHAYSEGLRRGHAVLVVQPKADMDRRQIIAVLEGTHPVDFDAKLEEWRQAGYSFEGPAGATATGIASGTGGMRDTDTTAAGTFRDAPSRTSAENDYMSGAETNDMPGGAYERPESRTESGTGAGGDAQAARVGRREALKEGSRIRSYVIDRPSGQ